MSHLKHKIVLTTKKWKQNIQTIFFFLLTKMFLALPRGWVGFQLSIIASFKILWSCIWNRYCTALRDGAPLEPLSKMAYILVIPTPNKDPGEVDNYCYWPISLIDNDLKLFTKVLANRLSSFINAYVHRDQVGFIPGLYVTIMPLIGMDRHRKWCQQWSSPLKDSLLLFTVTMRVHFYHFKQ